MNKDWIAKNAKATSNAEWTLRSAFERLGILDGSFMNEDFPFTPEICKKYGTKIRGTNIDRYYPDQRFSLFFDGPHHNKLNQQRKDEKIDEILKKEFHLIVRRIKFHTMTKGRALQFAQDIRATLELLGYTVTANPKITMMQCGFCKDEQKETLFVEDGKDKNCEDAYGALATHMWDVHCKPKIVVI